MVNPTIPALVCRIDKLLTRINTLELAVTNLQAAVDSSPPFYVGEVELDTGGATVVDTNIHAGSLVMLSRHTVVGTAGTLFYTLAFGSGFVITSSSATDEGLIVYQVFN